MNPETEEGTSGLMKVYTLEWEMILPVSVQEAFEIFQDPYNLPRVTPPWLNFRITSTERIHMRRGAEIHYRISWLKVPIAWKAAILEYEPPFYFVDQQERGPYRLWRHHHTLWPSEEGTVIRDRVEYALPFGLLGRIVHFLFVRQQLEAIFAYRQEALFELARTTATER